MRLIKEWWLVIRSAFAFAILPFVVLLGAVGLVAIIAFSALALGVSASAPDCHKIPSAKCVAKKPTKWIWRTSMAKRTRPSGDSVARQSLPWEVSLLVWLGLRWKGLRPIQGLRRPSAALGASCANPGCA